MGRLADGDEAFYALVGDNSCYSILELLHPQDLESFRSAAGRLGEGIQCVVARMRCYDQRYHLLYLELKDNGRCIDGFKSFDVEFCEFMDVKDKDKYKVYMQLIKKYREFLGLVPVSFFEYTFETDEINIYRYVNVRSVPLLRGKMEELWQQLVKSDETASVKDGVRGLYEALKRGTDQLDITITVPECPKALPVSGEDRRRRFKGRIMYKDGVKVLMAGTIECISHAEKPKSYYLTDSAGIEELIGKADKALYIAKAKGKNRYIIYDEKKHGSFVMDAENSGIRAAFVSDSKKAQLMQELALLLYRDRKKALPEVMKKMCAAFDIDGAAIYAGEDMRRCSYVGRYVNPIETLSWIWSQPYQELFDNQGVYMESNMSRFKSSYREAYNRYEMQENGKFVQCMAKREGRPAAVVAFDFFNRSPKLSITDTGYIRLIGTLMAEIATE